MVISSLITLGTEYNKFTEDRNMTKLEEMALNATKPHDYEPVENQTFQNGYVKGATDVLKEIEKYLKHLDYGIKAKCTVTTENAYNNLIKKYKELKG